jgi:hypothetical protein
VVWLPLVQPEIESMNAEPSDDRGHHDGVSDHDAHCGSIATLETTPSKLSKAVVSDPIYQDGIFRFSVRSATRYS